VVATLRNEVSEPRAQRIRPVCAGQRWATRTRQCFIADAPHHELGRMIRVRSAARFHRSFGVEAIPGSRSTSTGWGGGRSPRDDVAVGVASHEPDQFELRQPLRRRHRTQTDRHQVTQDPPCLDPSGRTVGDDRVEGDRIPVDVGHQTESHGHRLGYPETPPPTQGDGRHRSGERSAKRFPPNRGSEAVDRAIDSSVGRPPLGTTPAGERICGVPADGGNAERVSHAIGLALR